MPTYRGQVPTLPPEPPTAAQPGAVRPPHEARTTAQSFGLDAAGYDRARPAYPADLIHQLRVASPGPDVLDVGAGTGIEGRQLRDSGCRVLGVEPDERMAAFARRDGLEVEVATFESWEPAGRRFDAVVAGTAWHWIDPVAGAQKAASVLRPGGLLAPFWHTSIVPIPVQDALAEAFSRVAPESPVRMQSDKQGLEGYRPVLDRTVAGIERTGRFDAPEEWVFDWDQDYSRDEWLDQLPTWGILRPLPEAALGEVLRAVGETVDAQGGHLTVHYSSVVIAAQTRG